MANVHKLSARDQEDLTWFWCHAEGDIGLATQMRSVEEAAAVAQVIKFQKGKHRTAPRGVNLDFFDNLIQVHETRSAVRKDPMPDHAEIHRQRAWRMEHNLRLMVVEEDGAKHERVLFGIYGPPRLIPFADSKLGELAPIAAYTPSAIQLAASQTHDLLQAGAKSPQSRLGAYNAEGQPNILLVSPAQALDKVWRKQNPEFKSKVRDECLDLLHDASDAYTSVRYTDISWRNRLKKKKRAEFDAQLRAVMMEPEWNDCCDLGLAAQRHIHQEIHV